jgi:hypothetical protein
VSRTERLVSKALAEQLEQHGPRSRSSIDGALLGADAGSQTELAERLG